MVRLSPFWVLALGLGAAAALAQPAPLTLAQAFERAWARQPQAQALAARREAAQARADRAARWSPEPAALETSLRSDRLHRREGAQEFEVGVALPLWLPGERASSRELAGAEQRQLQAEQRLAQWQLAQTLIDRWGAHQQEREALGAAQERHQASRQLAADVARRVQAGELARADQHQADAEAAAAAADEARAQARAAAAAQGLRALLGLSAQEPLPAAEAPVADVADPAEAASPAEDGLDTHPLLAALRAQAERARSAAALARTQSRAHPELTLQHARERDARGEPRVGSLRLGLRFPLGDGDGQRARQATAAAEQIEAEVALARERERLQAEALAALETLRAARQVLQHSLLRARLAHETLGFIDRSFRLGQSDLPTRLRAEQEARSAQRELGRARIELQLATAQRRQALGLLPGTP